MSDLSLDNIVTNDMNFKHLETTKDITISIKNESGFPQRPDATHTWTAKVSDGTNYVGDYAVKINQNSLIVDSENFTKLPTGSYQLEVWEEWIDPDGTQQRSIYPSPSQTIPFTIYANLTDQAEKEIKSIGFQDVVDQAVMNVGMNYVFKVNTIEPDQTATVVQSAADGKNYVTFNIPQGPKGDQGNVGPAPTLKIGTVTKLNSDQTPTANISGDNGAYTLDLGIPQGAKGDTGTVDNAGLINAPAFQSLQTQVNNSAVGTNLILNSFTPQVLKRPEDNPSYPSWVGRKIYSGLKNNETYTFSALATAETTDKSAEQWGLRILSKSGELEAYSNTLDANTGKRQSLTFTTPDDGISYDVWIYAGAMGHDYTPKDLKVVVTISDYKLETGNVATDWCPNPSEILTQSDYAKIQAAIVALGGSLS